MAIALTLFNDEPITPRPAKENIQNNPLPIIAISKKKTATVDTPLEKEIKRFNNYIKQLHNYEEQDKQNKADGETLHKLYLNKIVPLLTEVAKARFIFVQHTDRIFYSQKVSKRMEHDFILFILTMLEQSAPFVDEAKKMFNIYVEKQQAILSKKEKKNIEKKIAEEEMFKGENNEGDTNYNFENENGFEYDENEFTNTRRSAKKYTKTPAAISVTELYKELVKMLHPDLEQNEQKRHTKEQLMKQLTAARDERDLFTMLLLKQKAHFLNGTQPEDSTYSLEKLKLYNKILKQKIDSFKNKERQQLFENIVMDSNGYIKSVGKKTTPDEKINAQVKELKKVKKGFDNNLSVIKDHDDIEMMLMEFMDEFNLS